jgi:hypothetical protein
MDGSVATPSAGAGEASGPTPTGNAPRPAQGGGIVQQILQSIVMYLFITSVFSYFKPKSSIIEKDHHNNNNNIESLDGVVTRIDKPTEFQTAIMGVSSDANLPVFPTRDHEGRKLGSHKCLFKKGIELDFYLFVTDDKYFNYLQDADKLVWSSFAYPSILSLSLSLLCV